MTKKIYSAYSKKPLVYNPVSGEPSRTKQEFKKEVDINTIISRMKRGIHPPAWMTSATPRYGDFTDMPATFQEAFALVKYAHESFMGLPLEFRRELDHDPSKLDTAPRELFEKYGLLKPKNSAEGSAPLSPQGGSRDPEGAPKDAPQGASKSAKKADLKTDD